MSRANAKTSFIGGCFGWAFVLFWCSITFAFDGVFGWNLFRQCWAYTFAETTGTITLSKLERVRDSDGDTQKLLVAYRFNVNGQQYTGDNYRYTMVSTNDRTWRKIHAELPVGKEVPVYYNASDPTDAVLVRGPMGMDLFHFWFLTPFNLIAIGGLIYLIRGARPSFDPNDPRVIAMTETGWQYRPEGRDWWLTFGIALGGIAFLGVFLIGFTLGFNPPLTVMVVVWASAIFLASLFARRTVRRVAIEVDEHQKSMTVIASRKEPRTFALAELLGFSVEVEEKVDSDGDRTTVHHVVVRWGEPVQTARVTESTERETAEAVADWLGKAIAASM